MLLLSNLYGSRRHISGVEPARLMDGVTVQRHAMHIPGPFFDHNWDWRSRSREIQDAQQQSGTNAGRIAWEIGVILLIPLAGAGMVEVLLRAFHVS